MAERENGSGKRVNWLRKRVDRSGKKKKREKVNWLGTREMERDGESIRKNGEGEGGAAKVV